mmetsp:Transcript_29317/g.70696  ORF Transcript_29317/g.70696 Transcript_29317/m.70696 type:complete len:954 (-) Transcript_29317:219-3080(-)
MAMTNVTTDSEEKREGGTGVDGSLFAVEALIGLGKKGKNEEDKNAEQKEKMLDADCLDHGDRNVKRRSSSMSSMTSMSSSASSTGPLFASPFHDDSSFSSRRSSIDGTNTKKTANKKKTKTKAKTTDDLPQWQDRSSGGGMTMKKGPFSFEEDEKLKLLIQEYGTSEWPTIASMMVSPNSKSRKRTPTQCRDRWKRHLNPALFRKNSGWTPEEDLTILRLKCLDQVTSWKTIQDDLPGRSDMCVKNRWNNTLRHKVDAHVAYKNNQDEDSSSSNQTKNETSFPHRWTEDDVLEILNMQQGAYRAIRKEYFKKCKTPSSSAKKPTKKTNNTNKDNGKVSLSASSSKKQQNKMIDVPSAAPQLKLSPSTITAVSFDTQFLEQGHHEDLFKEITSTSENGTGSKTTPTAPVMVAAVATDTVESRVAAVASLEEDTETAARTSMEATLSKITETRFDRTSLTVDTDPGTGKVMGNDPSSSWSISPQSVMDVVFDGASTLAGSTKLPECPNPSKDLHQEGEKVSENTKSQVRSKPSASTVVSKPPRSRKNSNPVSIVLDVPSVINEPFMKKFMKEQNARAGSAVEDFPTAFDLVLAVRPIDTTEDSKRYSGNYFVDRLCDDAARKYLSAVPPHKRKGSVQAPYVQAVQRYFYAQGGSILRRYAMPDGTSLFGDAGTSHNFTHRFEQSVLRIAGEKEFITDVDGSDILSFPKGRYGGECKDRWGNMRFQRLCEAAAEECIDRKASPTSFCDEIRSKVISWGGRFLMAVDSSDDNSGTAERKFVVQTDFQVQRKIKQLIQRSVPKVKEGRKRRQSEIKELVDVDLDLSSQPPPAEDKSRVTENSTTSVPSRKRQIKSDASSSNKRTKKNTSSIRSSSTVKFLKKPKRKRSRNSQLQHDMNKISEQFPFSPQAKNLSRTNLGTMPAHSHQPIGGSSSAARMRENYVGKVDAASLLMNLRSK